MIWDSAYWKDDLLKQARDLRRRRSQRRWTDRSLGRLEQGVMLGFYSIRKLIEAKKLTDEVATVEVPMLSYRSRGKPITRLNWHHVEDLYDLGNGVEEALKLPELCNQFIHSYVFLPLMDECNGLAALYVTSDRFRERKLFEVAVERLAWLFELVGSDEAAGSAMVYSEKRRDYDVIICNTLGSTSRRIDPEIEKAANQALAPDGWRRR